MVTGCASAEEPQNWVPRDLGQPNIIILLADDLGYGDIGPYGAARIATPHLDRLAAEGVVLTSFYASASVCTPSRAGLLTGRYPVRQNLVLDVARPTNRLGIAADEITVAELLRERGYRTAIIGKWHLGHRPEQWPTEHGFDYYYGLPYSNDMTPLALYRGTEVIEEPVNQTTLTERYTEEAIRFIEESGEEPFFVYLAHSMPHVPLFVSERFAGRSDAGLYGDVVETIDWGVGELLATLERLDLDENTLVVFTSDNGPWWEGSTAGLRSRKGNAWEGGLRVPFVARWPAGIPPSTTSDAATMNIDLLPTLVALAGGALPDDRPIDGRDISSVLRGSHESPHEALYLYRGDRIAAVRSGDWKLVVESFYVAVLATIGHSNYYYHPGLLFDLADDPAETYSVTREHPEVAVELRALLEKGRGTIENTSTPPGPWELPYRGR